MILLIGATGQTGGETARQLAAAGQKVRALVRNPARAEGLRQLGVEVVQGDAEHPETVKPALEGIDTVLFATSPDERLPELQKKIIATVKDSVRRIAKISAVGARTDSRVVLLRVHGITDEVLRNSGVQFTIIQPVFFMQNLLGSAAMIAGQGVFVQPSGGGKESLIDVRDIGTFAAAVLTQPGHENQTYAISGPEALTGDEIAQKLSLALSRKVAFVSPEPAEYKRALIAAGLGEYLAQGLLELSEMIARGEGAMVTDTYRQVTGKEPLSFDRFARDHAQVFLQQAAGR